MIDPRLVRALAGIVRAGNTHQRACLIGGQALRDLSGALEERLGTGLPAVRASQDVDLLLSLGTDREADQALRAVLEEAWEPLPGRQATYCWREDPTVALDLATTWDAQERPGQAASITIGSGRPIRAYRMIPSWLHGLNLTEPCHASALRGIGLERLRHTALLVSKILAVDVCLSAHASADPPIWTERLDRDLDDVRYLTDRRLRPSLWCVASTTKRLDLRRHLQEPLERVHRAAAGPPPTLGTESRDRLRLVADGLPTWRP